MNITTNAPEVAGGVRAIVRDQIPFALALSTNRLGNRVQEVQRAHHFRIFAISERTFADRSVKIRRNERATKQRPEVVVRYETPGSRKRADIFTKFEADTRKTPFSGRFLWVPIEAPRKDRNWRPSKLGLKPQRPGKRSRLGREGRRPRQAGTKVLVGKRNTFAIIRSDSRPSFIFERDGEDLTLLYISKPRVPILPELAFEENATRTVAIHAEPEFQRAFDQALGIGR